MERRVSTADTSSPLGRQAAHTPQRTVRHKTPDQGSLVALPTSEPRDFGDAAVAGSPVVEEGMECVMPSQYVEVAEPAEAHVEANEEYRDDEFEVPSAATPPDSPAAVERHGPEIEFLHRIGRGAFGEVFAARNNATGETIAVKRLVVSKDQQCRDTSKMLQKLEREITVMRELDHPNIVKYLGAERREDGLDIFMELAEDGSVGTLIRRDGPLTEDTAKNLVGQLLRGLAYLHSKRIAHRDLKCDNLFLQRDTLKVGDFGTSKEIHTLQSKLHSIAGTPNFMAPEIIEGSGHSLHADVWSVGCCCIQMITGKPPFSHLDNPMAIMFSMLNGKIFDQVPSTSSAALRDFVVCCCAKKPDARWPCRDLVEHEWLGGTRTSATPREKGDKERRRPHPHRSKPS